MDQQSQIEQAPNIPIETSQLIDVYQLGLPLALHNTRSEVLRRYKLLNLMLLSIAICVFLVGLVAVLINVYQLQILESKHAINAYDALLLEEQILRTENALIEECIPLILGFLWVVGAIVRMWLVARELPGYILICTDGLLEVRPKKVDVTRWAEVTSLMKMPGTAKRKSYMLVRRNRKPLFFGNALANVEDLATLIRHHISK